MSKDSVKTTVKIIKPRIPKPCICPFFVTRNSSLEKRKIV